MSSLSKLIQNENMKIYRRPRTWVMIGFLLLTVALLSGIMKWDESKMDLNNWEQALSQENEQFQQELTSNKELDAQQTTYLSNQIKLNQYYLDSGINPNDLSLWDHVNSSVNLTMLVTLLTVIIAADMIAAEFSWGTIKLLLVGPASRTKIMASKYIATMGFALLLLVICFAAAFAAGGILEGFNSVSQPLVTIDAADSSIQESSMIVNALQKYGFAVISLIMYVTMAFMISAAFRSTSMAIAFSLLFMLVGNTLTAILSSYSWVKYLLFANIDLTQYLDGAEPLRPEMTLSFSILILVAYYALFQFTAWLLFTKRDVAA
ncbi:ABC transporter permease [Paenibacillus sp. NEAU-GSW1]|uniref:ABC transporter permease n=1 Tax=Paenibacillus sp. NEAU-GSW1 TaxID=2682486 RepID=UPI0012E141B7|nr:ABC transporter permease [Paenibacillus sp. NEAU-GSW1]MUT65755.1 ABC transporter permease subunit [Paenibacillus sp. NEAU-GSW1]